MSWRWLLRFAVDLERGRRGRSGVEGALRRERDEGRGAGSSKGVSLAYESRIASMSRSQMSVRVKDWRRWREERFPREVEEADGRIVDIEEEGRRGFGAS